MLLALDVAEDIELAVVINAGEWFHKNRHYDSLIYEQLINI